MISHDQTYTMEVLCHKVIVGQGTAKSKRKAISAAAENALETGDWKSLADAGAVAGAYDVGAKGI